MLFLERLRTAQDRQHLLGLYEQCWGHPLPLLSTPELSISPETVKLGWAKLPRTQALTELSAGTSNLSLVSDAWFLLVVKVHSPKAHMLYSL